MAVTYDYYEDSTGQWWAFSINSDGSASTSTASPQGSSMGITYSYFEDSAGQFWAFNINPDGSASTSPISAPTPNPNPQIVLPDINCTNTLLDTMEWAKKHMANRSTAIGNFLEPAITSANIIRQTILDAPFAWRWNRTVTGFITNTGQQDYYIFNWEGMTPVALGWMTVDNYGCCQMCTKSGTTGTGSSPTWNGTIGGFTTDGSGSTFAVWQNMGVIGVPVSQTYDFGFMETVSVFSSAKWYEIQDKICLSSDSALARPRFIAAQGDDNSGNINFRLMPIPDVAYPVAITIQESSPMFTGVNQTWAPIPDYMSSMYNWGFLALMFMFADDPRFTLANQKFVATVLAVSEGLEQTEINIFLNNWQEVTGSPLVRSAVTQSGMQARNSAG